MTYYIILIMGCTFGILFVIVALFSQKYPMKYLIGKKFICYIGNRLIITVRRHLVVALRCGIHFNTLDLQFLP